jgi:dihydrofolate reductase
MRRLVVSEFLTLDGVMEDPGGSEDSPRGGWSFKFPDPDGMRFKLDETLAAEILLLGRVTYEGFAAAWPGRTDEAGFADKMNSMAKYVYSETLADPTWENTTVISGDLAAAVGALKEEDGGDILVAGSRTLAQALLAADLVDELRLMVHPIVLGAGKRLFGETDREVAVELAEARPLSSGTVILIYRRPGA